VCESLPFFFIDDVLAEEFAMRITGAYLQEDKFTLQVDLALHGMVRKNFPKGWCR
jgi:hypothetical protein